MVLLSSKWKVLSAFISSLLTAEVHRICQAKKACTPLARHLILIASFAVRSPRICAPRPKSSRTRLILGMLVRDVYHFHLISRWDETFTFTVKQSSAKGDFHAIFFDKQVFFRSYILFPFFRIIPWYSLCSPLAMTLCWVCVSFRCTISWMRL
jgi:hypothetical protein